MKRHHDTALPAESLRVEMAKAKEVAATIDAKDQAAKEVRSQLLSRIAAGSSDRRLKTWMHRQAGSAQPPSAK